MSRRSPSPTPTVTLDVKPKQKLYRSSSEESIRSVQQALVFQDSPTGQTRVAYITRIIEPDYKLVERQLAAIALQPLTFAEQLAVKRKQLEAKAEKRKREKAAAAEAKAKMVVPQINVTPASGRVSAESPVPPIQLSPKKSKVNTQQQLNAKVKHNRSKSESFHPSITNTSVKTTNGNIKKKNIVGDIVTSNIGKLK